MRLARWAAALLCAAALPAAGQLPSFSEQAQQRLRFGPDGEAAQAQRALHRRWVDEGQARLEAGDTAAARKAFEQAAAMAHAADIEIGLVRAHMQAGEYRQALAFAAHTAGAHADVGLGSALYGWLLWLGGQPSAAGSLLDAAVQRLPADAALQRTLARTLDRSAPADAEIDRQLEPYRLGAPLPADARVVGSGTLLAAGRLAIVPAVVGAQAAQLWLRDGLGRTRSAAWLKSDPGTGLALLAVQGDGAGASGPAVAPNEAFAGSPAFALGYPPAVRDRPQWPILSLGFLGRPDPQGSQRPLGFDLYGALAGGPVFDAMGRLTGVSVAGDDGVLRLASSASVQALWPELASLAAAAPAPNAHKMSVDEIYERALRFTVQVIAAPSGSPKPQAAFSR